LDCWHFDFVGTERGDLSCVCCVAQMVVEAMETAPLLLSDIRGDLIRQEETIIFALIERSQFPSNSTCYKRGESAVLQARLGNVEHEQALSDFSFMEYFLYETESLHAKLGRYGSPDENAFFPNLLPKSGLVAPPKRSPLKPNMININNEVLGVYTEQILQELCCNTDTVDDGEYGSTCACDIAVLQALSKRIHYGKFVAEAKFQADREGMAKLILANDADGIMQALTNEAVEEKVIERVRTKASRYGVDGTSDESVYKVRPDVIAELYRDYLIPLNKKVQVRYLLERLERPSFAHVDICNSIEAGKTRFEGNSLLCNEIQDVFVAVTRNQVAFGVVPIQDSERGFFKATQMALLSSNLKVCESIMYSESKDRWTRFYVIGPNHTKVSKTGSHVVAFFGVQHEPGSLVSALKALDNANLSCLESFTRGHTPDGKIREFGFFCEIEGHCLDEAAIQDILQKLKGATSFVDFVGSY